MQTNESNLTPKSDSTMRCVTEINNNNNILAKNEISQLFNKVYDSNFLSMINELSISIQNFHKSYVNQSNILKSLFKENLEKINDNLDKIKYSFNEIDSLSSKFYSDAKLIFKKMKIYRSNIIKNNNQSELKTKHKKSVSINYNIDNINNKLSNIKEDIKIKKSNNMDIDDYNTNNNVKGSNSINKIFQKKKINNICLSNNDSNNSSKSNVIINGLNKNLREELSNKNKDDLILIEFYDKFVQNLLSCEELINCNDGNNKILSLKELLNGKKNDLIKCIKNLINISKENTSSFKENLSNKINVLEEENNKIKIEFENYKSEEKIRKKFLENQILSLSKKDIDNTKFLKSKEKELNENKKHYEENIKKYEENISNLKSNINTLNNKINENLNMNEKLKKQNQEIIEEKNKEINKINEKYEKIINEKDQYHKNELNNICKNKDNDILQIKNEINELNKKTMNLKEENEKLINSLNQKEIKIKELSSINQEVIKISDIKENIIEENKNIINEIKIKNKELNDINVNNNTKIRNLENKIKDNKEKLDKQIDINEEITKKYDELNKKYNSNQSEISELKLINNKYNKTVIELEQENKEINNLLIENKKKLKDDKNKLNKKVEELQKEINELNKKINNKNKENEELNKKIKEKDEIILEYQNKYENEIKKNNKLEKRIQEYNLKEEEGNMTEYENKKRKIPNRRYTNNNIEIENVEKKFRFLYKTMENFNVNKSRNPSKKTNHSNISKDIINKNKENSDLKNIFERQNTISNLNKVYSNKNIYDKKILNNNINDNNDEKEESSTNTNIIENSTDNLNIKITPENYSFIKCYQLNSKLKWCLFKKKDKKNSLLTQKKYHYRRYSISRESTANTNISNSELDSSNYKDFIWMPYKTNKDFTEFGDISINNENLDIKSEKGEDINEYKSVIKKLENKMVEKDNEYNKLDNYNKKLMNENKKYKNNIEKLIKENVDLNNQILKYKLDLKNDKNFIGVSFIDDDPESSKFIDDKCCEDILSGLNKEKEKNQIKKTSVFTKNLKNSIDMLMTKVIPSENIRSLLASILRQLGCSDEDIFRLLGNYRGVISIPFSYNKFFNK